MKVLIPLLALLPGFAFADVIKNDTFTVETDTPLENHTSDSGGGWQSADDEDADVIAVTDSVAGDGSPPTLTPVGDENPTQTDYFVEVTGTLGGTTTTDAVGAVARGDHGASGDAADSTYYACILRGGDGWVLRRYVEGSFPPNLDTDLDYSVDNSIGAATVVKVKLELAGTGATVEVKCHIDPDGGGYDLVADFDDTDANRITTAGNVGLAIIGTNARITSINAESTTETPNAVVVIESYRRGN